jgi:hypothetical protein
MQNLFFGEKMKQIVAMRCGTRLEMYSFFFVVALKAKWRCSEKPAYLPATKVAFGQFEKHTVFMVS